MAGWFELKKHKNEQFGFVLKAGNGEIILNSEQYKTKAAAENGIESVRTNSPLEERYDCKAAASTGSPYFTLKAANGQVIGVSEMYSSAQSRDKGIESVKVNGISTNIKDFTGN